MLRGCRGFRLCLALLSALECLPLQPLPDLLSLPFRPSDLALPSLPGPPVSPEKVLIDNGLYLRKRKTRTLLTEVPGGPAFPSIPGFPGGPGMKSGSIISCIIEVRLQEHVPGGPGGPTNPPPNRPGINCEKPKFQMIAVQQFL